LISALAFVFNGFMKAGFRISVKDNSRDKNLKVQLYRLPWGRQFLVRMNGEPWPKAGRPVPLSRVFASLRKAVVRGDQRRTWPVARPAARAPVAGIRSG
jgi:hypothetical protein